MKKELKYIIAVFIGFLLLLWIAKPLQGFMVNHKMPELYVRLIAGIIVRLFIVVILFRIVKNLGLKKFNGLGKNLKFSNLQVLLIPSIFIIIGILGNWTTYINANLWSLFLFTISVFLVGFAEELLFRGTILPLFIYYFKSRKGVLFLSVILSSLLFGMIHFINIFNQPDNFMGITRQVFFATSMGVFFGGLLLRTNSIIVSSLFHGIVNFSFGPVELIQGDGQMLSDEITKGINMSSVILTTLFFTFIFIGGIYMVKKVNKKQIFNRLDIITEADEI